ncbi:MAG: hypothetical protein K9L66_10010 [Spirochaetaceae bacterium]|nr:hypothetical protein [Spirochaetaceae bacterium]MCF7948226.1 hypothetical protein [Spirochaetia bacterium]MCF7951830.1 hypothetical protein [Spirochaetaceae bacterium]
MSCNAVDLQNVHFWLVLSAGGLGCTLGALLKAVWLARKGAGLLVRISLYLSASMAAVLGGIVFLDLSQVVWNRFLLIFFLLAIGGWTVFYIGFRYLVVPLVLVMVLYIVMVSGLVRQWGCCLSAEQLLQVKVIAQQERAGQSWTELEIHTAGSRRSEFVQIQGKDLAVSLSLLEFQPWLFYPNCEFLFQVEKVDGLTEQDTDATNVSSGVGTVAVSDTAGASALLAVGAAELREITVVQRELDVLGTYELVDKEGSLVFQRSKQKAP